MEVGGILGEVEVGPDVFELGMRMTEMRCVAVRYLQGALKVSLDSGPK